MILFLAIIAGFAGLGAFCELRARPAPVKRENPFGGVKWRSF